MRLLVHALYPGIALVEWGGGKKPGAVSRSGIPAAIGGWAMRFVTKSLDLIGTGEMLDAIFTAVKPGTRGLNAVEITEAHKVFGAAVDYHRVRIDETSRIAKWGRGSDLSAGMAVCLFHTINFLRSLATQPGNRDMAWLIHELTHVAQMEAIGIQYIPESIFAQYTRGYNYGGPENLGGKSLAEFNREQQGDIARDFYFHSISGKLPESTFQPAIAQLRQGKFR